MQLFCLAVGQLFQEKGIDMQKKLPKDFFTWLFRTVFAKEDVEFYFTQSWVNITRPGEFHHRHSHQNSIISGIFYLNSVKNDNVNFYHPMGSLFHQNQLNYDKLCNFPLNEQKIYHVHSYSSVSFQIHHIFLLVLFSLMYNLY